MEAFRISVKFFAENGSSSDQAFVPMFHRWIQGRLVPDHLLVDVADYSHVHRGSGIVLVSHEANFYMDRLDGRLGLTYHRKQPLDGDFSARLAQAIRTALEACQRIEADAELGGTVRFKTNELSIRFHDRLLAPSNSETFSIVRPEIQSIAQRLYPGAAVSLEHRNSGPAALFEVSVKASQSPELATLARRA